MSKFDELIDTKLKMYKEYAPVQPTQPAAQQQPTTQTAPQQPSSSQPAAQQSTINFKDPKVVNDILTGLSNAAKDPSIAKIIADFQKKSQSPSTPSTPQQSPV